jgi:hypothetical protein
VVASIAAVVLHEPVPSLKLKAPPAGNNNARFAPAVFIASQAFQLLMFHPEIAIA